MASGIVVKTSFQEQLNKITDLGKLYIRQEFTGGTDDALDSIDGANLGTGVTAFVLKDDICYIYKYIDGATDPENPPSVVAPDTNSNGRWFLYSVSDSDKLDGFHASQSPSANTIPVLNSSGQLWLPFNQTPILVNGQDMMSRVFYVDAVNGNDNNDGSESTPFKTIKKAIDSIPAGGSGKIHLKSDIVVSDTGKISLNDSGKLIYISGYNTETPDNRRTMQFKIKPLGSYNTVYGFTYLGGCAFSLHYVNIEFVDESASNLNFNTFGQAFDYASKLGGGFALYLNTNKVTIPDNDAVNLVHANGAGTGTIMIGVYASEINTVGTNSYPFRISKSTFIYNVFSATLSGNKTSHSDLFIGIVKDANDVPRNIVSNIVL